MLGCRWKLGLWIELCLLSVTKKRLLFIYLFIYAVADRQIAASGYLFSGGRRTVQNSACFEIGLLLSASYFGKLVARDSGRRRHCFESMDQECLLLLYCSPSKVGGTVYLGTGTFHSHHRRSCFFFFLFGRSPLLKPRSDFSHIVPKVFAADTTT